ARATKVPAAPDWLTIHVVYLPAGVSYVESGQVNCDCSELAAAHYFSDTTNEVIAFVQRCPWPGHTDLEGLTFAASHEIIESATDAVPEAGYALRADPSAEPWQGPVLLAAVAGSNEVADLCPDTVVEGPWTYTKSWSNARAAAGIAPCVPASPAAV